jgi:hypothetical protein
MRDGTLSPVTVNEAWRVIWALVVAGEDASRGVFVQAVKMMFARLPKHRRKVAHIPGA